MVRTLAVLLVLLAGCAAITDQRPARPLEPGSRVALADGEALIFGGILFVENGIPKYPYGLGKPMLKVKNLSGRWPYLGADRHGAFYLAVPAGRYEIMSAAPLYYSPMICLPYRFEAPQPGKAYYIGALRIEFESTVVLGGLWGNYVDSVDYVEVLDQLEAAAPALAALGPGAAALPVEKALMSRIPGRRPGLGYECR